MENSRWYRHSANVRFDGGMGHHPNTGERVKRVTNPSHAPPSGQDWQVHIFLSREVLLRNWSLLQSDAITHAGFVHPVRWSFDSGFSEGHLVLLIHDVWCLESWNVNSGQPVQVVAPSTLEYRPASHAKQNDCPVLFVAYPAGHRRHCVLSISTLSRYKPLWQSIQVAAPSTLE